MAHVLNIWNSLNWHIQHSGLFIVELIKLPHSTSHMVLSHISYSNQCESLELYVWQLAVGSWQLIKTVISNWVRMYGILHKTEKPTYGKTVEWTGKKRYSHLYFTLFLTVPTVTYRKLMSSCLRFLICQMGLISFAWNMWKMSIFKIKCQTSAI